MHGRGIVLELRIVSPEFHTNKYGQVPVLQAALVDDWKNGSLNIFVLNCGEQPLTTELVFRGYKGRGPVEHEILAGDDLQAVNSIEDPSRVQSKPAGALPEEIGANSFRTVLPGHSWNMIRFS